MMNWSDFPDITLEQLSKILSKLKEPTTIQINLQRQLIDEVEHCCYSVDLLSFYEGESKPKKFNKKIEYDTTTPFEEELTEDLHFKLTEDLYPS